MSTEPLFAIVDDDEAIRQALSELLEVSGWSCLTFSNAQAFIAAHAPGRFAAVVTDLNLPGQSGLQLQRHLRCVEPGLPVIVISAQSEPGVRVRCLASGAVAYLTKPISDELLLVHLTAAAKRG